MRGFDTVHHVGRRCYLVIGRAEKLKLLCYIRHGGAYPMQGEIGERWKKLCEQAAVEQDPQKLLPLIEEIDRLLEVKEERLQQAARK